MKTASAKVVSEGKFEILVTAKVKSREEVEQIIAAIKEFNNVYSVIRNNLN